MLLFDVSRMVSEAVSVVARFKDVAAMGEAVAVGEIFCDANDVLEGFQCRHGIDGFSRWRRIAL
jgi:hypothetical protein